MVERNPIPACLSHLGQLDGGKDALIRQLHAALNAIAWDCHPDFNEFANPAAARAYLYRLATEAIGPPTDPGAIPVHLRPAP